MTYPVRALALLATVLAAAVASPARAAETYTVDPVHSSVVFRVKHMNTSYAWGRFNDLGGSFALDQADPAQSKLQFQVKSTSVDTANPKRDQHLRGPDFLNAVQFPTIGFASTGVAKSSDGYEVSGNLTLHGVTKPITFRLTPTGSGKSPMGAAIAGIEASFTIKQSDFGITKMAAMIGDEVWINVSVEGVRQAR
jgi:polyisoprenoid-binding protein YceI